MRFALLASLLVACSGPSSAPPVEPAQPPPPAPVDTTVPAQPSALAADGAACKVATDCASGVCEGEGCGDDTLGHCAPAKRGCTRDRREFCGCDGNAFFGSSSCPGQRYANKGACTP